MATSVDLPLRKAQGSTSFLCRLLNNAWARYAAWAAYRRSLHDLRELSDHLLADIGLTQADQARGRAEF
ncbi:MAG TPA: DUF1127 domain-containing protein [Ferrovibrio sp.]|uniref:DUF1127 domain-containing protein n=1 Tax=Ferrovibrio sp. TaxID=1917215 RepID=UPI002ED0C246